MLLNIEYKYAAWNSRIFTTVWTQFVTNRNSVRFVRKKAQTISFIERGFERLGLSHQTAGLFMVFIHG